jgi:hypothetical protein
MCQSRNCWVDDVITPFTDIFTDPFLCYSIVYIRMQRGEKIFTVLLPYPLLGAMTIYICTRFFSLC